MSRKRDAPVRLDRIYTRGGDGGETSLGDGTRVRKTDPRIAAYGAVDELNCALGLAAVAVPAEFRGWLERIQNELFDLGADLAVPLDAPGDRLRIARRAIDALEQLCDSVNEQLEPLRSFVLPGGTEASARLHVARAACRRAERETIALAEATTVNPLAVAYLNRLSDFLFILARAANRGAAELLWRPGTDR
jgi:cob(I)alamin adenosyltransferase